MHHLIGWLRPLICLALCCSVAAAEDWPMWRGDAQRSGQWSGELAESLHLQWVRHYPALQPAYQNQRLQFDAGYEPVVKDGTLLVGSSRNDRMTALDAATGQEKWRFYTDGPIRFAPVAWKDRVYFGSDDGFLYCLEIDSGTLLWKFRAAPSTRKLLGNGRLISTWPVRGGPVIADDILYFAAGVWSFEGVFVYALDAHSGEQVWLNDRTGFLYGQHPHDAQAFGGLTPQGYLVVHDDELIVPCGTALPARLDRATGQLKHFALPRQGRSPGGWFTAAARAKRRGQPVPEEEQDGLVFDSTVSRDRHEGGWHEGAGTAGTRSRVTLGGREIAFEDGYPGVQGTVHSVLAAEDRLFVVTQEGAIHCFGPTEVEPKIYPLQVQPQQPQSDATVASAKKILAASGANSGYALMLGASDGPLAPTAGSVAEALARLSELQLIVIEPDEQKCAQLRQRLDALGLLGTRVAVYQGPVDPAEFPPYLANLIACENLEASGLFAEGVVQETVVQQLFQVLRPFGGTAYLNRAGTVQAAQNAASQQHAARQAGNTRSDFVSAGMDGAAWETAGDFAVLRRQGPLPGTANYLGGWASGDDRVAAPLGVLWFDDALAHFKRAPQPMIVDGVMVSYDKHWKGWVDGDRPPYSLVPPTYSDIYTGRILSPTELGSALHSLPVLDLNEKQPQQYRPPTQQDDWKPTAPVIGERMNPLTGQSEPRAIPKSYGCDGGVDYGNLYTLRSGTAAFYDKQLESGTVHISGPRSGCTNSVIPAGGLLNVPYFFQGCTCSYPLPVGLALVSVPQQREQWAVWGEGKADSIRRLGINFGAPGTRMTPAGTLWLEHPHAGGPAPTLELTTGPETAVAYYRHSLWIEGGSGWSWVAASGIQGLNTVSLQGLQSGQFTVRLYFAEPEPNQGPGQRVFDVALQGNRVLEAFDIAAEAGGSMRGVVKEFREIELDGDLQLELTPRAGEPLLSGIELVVTGLPLDPLEMPDPDATTRRTMPWDPERL